MSEDYCFDLDSMPKVLQTLDGVTLAEMDLPPIKYVIKDLLPQGLAMLNGSMKIGKSWMVLDWCVRIAKGENIWNFPTTKGTTLYLSLEDSNTRLQDRLLSTPLFLHSLASHPSLWANTRVSRLLPVTWEPGVAA